MAGAAAAAPEDQRPRAVRKPFDGVTLQFAKAPFGTDEKDVIAKLLKPFEDKTGREGRAHGRPVERRGRDLRDELRRSEPVRRELPDEHRPDRSRHEGRPRGAEHEAVARTRRRTRRPKAKFIPNTIKKSTYQGKLYGLPCIIGGTVIYYNKDLLAKAGVTKSREPSPSSAAAARRSRSSATASGATTSRCRTRTSPGTSSTTASTTAASTSSRRTGKKVTFNTAPAGRGAAVLRRPGHEGKVQPPVGQYDREAGVSLFKAGRIGFLHDEPLRLAVFREREAPVQVGLHQPGRASAGSGRSSRRPGTGSWPRRARTRTRRGSS